jgi:hypothetical protein
MYLGVCSCPIDLGDQKCDGKIFLKRVSETNVAVKRMHSNDFCDEFRANKNVIDNWRQSVNATMSAIEMIAKICLEFPQVDESIRGKLVLRYKKSEDAKSHTYLKPEDTIADRTVKCNNPNGFAFSRPLQISDLDLKVQREKGEEYEKDTTCDSVFMSAVMPEIGQEIRAKYHWVPVNKPIYLVMDNAGELV